MESGHPKSVSLVVALVASQLGGCSDRAVDGGALEADSPTVIDPLVGEFFLDEAGLGTVVVAEGGPCNPPVALGDIDGDGLDEIAVWDDYEGSDVWLLRDLPQPPTRGLLTGSPWWTQASEQDLIVDVVAVGDVDGDGSAEVGVLRPYRLDLYDAGAPETEASQPRWSLRCSAPRCAAQPGGDIDGDGRPDLIVATDVDVYVVTAAQLLTGEIDAFSDGVGIEAEAVRNTLNINPIPGDLDGDGMDDIVFSYATEQGHVLAIHYGAATLDQSGPDGVWVIEAQRPLFGGGVGDLDGDGVPELLVTRAVVSTVDQPPAPVFIPGTSARRLGQTPLARTGSVAVASNEWGSVRIVGDVDGDGRAEIAGSTWQEPDGQDARVGLWYGGPSSGSAAPPDATFSGLFLDGPLQPAGDLNGDGFGDLAISHCVPFAQRVVHVLYGAPR